MSLVDGKNKYHQVIGSCLGKAEEFGDKWEEWTFLKWGTGIKGGAKPEADAGVDVADAAAAAAAEAAAAVMGFPPFRAKV